MSPRKPLQKATVAETACDTECETTSNVDKRILDRIQKCLNRAYHANASEAEAKTALFISQKLMSEHNVTQADLLANEGTDNKAQYGGRSIVQIEKVGGVSLRVQREAFVNVLASAMCTFFDCKYFSTDCHTKITWTFYGIASNTVAAAMAFEMVHNLILEWAMKYKGGSATFCYRLGVADGLGKMADREKKAELEEVKRTEEFRRKETEGQEAQEPREPQEPQEPQKVKIEEVETTDEQDYESDSETAAPLTSGHPMDSYAFGAGEDSNDNEDSLDNTRFHGTQIKADFNINDIPVIDLCSDDDLDETINRYIKREPSEPLRPSTLPACSSESNKPVKDEPETPKSSTSGWQSQMQLALFRTTSKQVADDYLTQENIKLCQRKKRKSTISDRDSYHQGHKDSAKINIRQKKLCS